MVKKQYFLSLIAIVSCLAFSMGTGGAIANEKTLCYGRGGDSLTLDPYRTSDSESLKVFPNIFDTLITFKDGSSELMPSLAESWSVSPNEKEWIFRLKKGVVFHDGTKFDAESVKYSLTRLFDKNHPNYRNDLPYQVFFSSIEKMLVEDKYTIKFLLKTPYAPFLYNLCLPSASIISPASLKTFGDDIDKHPVGTGPFVFSSWVPGKTLTLKKNVNYWGEAPEIDTVVFKVIENDKDRLRALKSGAIQIMDSFSYSVIQEFHKDDKLKLWKGQGLNIGYLALNTGHKHLSNKKVRQAINHAINKTRLIKLFCQNIAIPAVNPIPPNQWGFNDAIVDYEYNPKKARQLLKEAGYDEGFDITLFSSPLSRSYLPYPDKLASYIKANLDVVGIRVQIVKHDWKVFWAKIMKKEHDIVMTGWSSDNGDPDNFLFTLLHSQNRLGNTSFNLANFEHKELDEILIKAQKVSDKSKRIALYKKAQVIFHEAAPWVLLAHGQVLIATSKEVNGITLMPILPNVRLNKVWIE